MSVSAVIPKPSKQAKVGDLINYYTKMKKWKQVYLANSARIEPSRLNKIIKNTAKSPTTVELVSISLALQLSLEDATELLERAGRALSPAFEEHCAYKFLIEQYNTRNLSQCTADNILDSAAQFLKARNIYSFRDPLKV